MPSLTTSFHPAVGPIIQIGLVSVDNQHKLYDALIDTGASSTCISTRIVEDLALMPVGMREMASASEVCARNMYIADIVVPFGITALMIKGVQLMEFHAPNNFDILLGRDIICQGHLTMSFDGHLTFSL